MTKAEAKKLVCRAVVQVMENSAEGGGAWLEQDAQGNLLGEEDRERMLAAFNDLMTELWRRGT